MCEPANWAIRNPDETNQRTSLPPAACCGRALDPFSASSTATSTFGASETPRYDGALMSKWRMSSCSEPRTFLMPPAPSSAR